MSRKTRTAMPKLAALAAVALWAAPMGTGQDQPAAPATPPPSYEEVARKAKAYDDNRSLLVGFLIANIGLAGLLIYHAGMRGNQLKHHADRLGDHSGRISAATAAAAQEQTQLALALGEIRKDFGWEQRQLREENRVLRVNMVELAANLANALKDVERLRTGLAGARRD